MPYNLTAEYNEARSGILATVLIICIILDVVLNTMALYVFFRVKHPIRRPPFYFLAALAFVDILGAALWALPSLAASVMWTWFGDEHLCRFHSFVAMFCYSMNMHLFVAIMFEKFCKILFPSKHKDAFYNKKVVGVILFALIIFDIVIAFLHLVGWGEANFFSYQFQCAPDYEKSANHLSFIFSVTYAIPTVMVIILGVAILIKIKSLKQKVGPSTNEKLVLEERKDVVKESFAEKLKKQQASFNMAGMKKKKPKIGKKNRRAKKRKNDDDDIVMSDDGYESESSTSSQSSHYESSDDDQVFVRDYDDFKRMRNEKSMAKKKKRIYVFRRSDMLLAITIFICFVVYILLWLGYWIISFTWVYTPQQVTLAGYVFFTVVTFIGITFKPLVYVTNKQLRAGLLAAFKCKRKKRPPPSKQPPKENQPIVTTSVTERHYTYEENVTTTTTRTAEQQPSRNTTTKSVRTDPDMVNLYQQEETNFQF